MCNCTESAQAEAVTYHAIMGLVSEVMHAFAEGKEYTLSLEQMDLFLSYMVE